MPRRWIQSHKTACGRAMICNSACYTIMQSQKHPVLQKHPEPRKLQYYKATVSITNSIRLCWQVLSLWTQLSKRPEHPSQLMFIVEALKTCSKFAPKANKSIQNQSKSLFIFCLNHCFIIFEPLFNQILEPALLISHLSSLPSVWQPWALRSIIYTWATRWSESNWMGRQKNAM